ncbi:hypothetical protein K6Y81_47970, partial [Burkholderia cenocepacia]|nr:hypothetical protein [Burkholderia cenocepacia]
WLLLRPVSPRYFANKIEKEIQKYSRENGQYMAFIPSKFKEKEVFPSGTFDKTIDLPSTSLTGLRLQMVKLILKMSRAVTI